MDTKQQTVIGTESVAQPAEVVAISSKRLHGGRFGLAESQRNLWQAILDGSTDYREIFESDYWGHVAAKVRPYDRIEVLTDAGDLFAELIVLAAGKSQLVVKELRKVHITPAEMGEAEESYGVKWAGPYSKYRVFRQSDGMKIKEGFDTADDARAYLAANNRRHVA